MGLNIQDKRRTLFALVSFIAGGIVPIQLITLSFGYAQYLQGVVKGPKVITVAHQFAAAYLPFVYLPALLVLAGIALYSRTRYPDLYRRIVVGFSAGAIATIALDVARQTGVIYGWLPADTPVLFGKMATASSSFAIFYSAGLLIHYLNGANFGLFYAFVWGKRESYRMATLWATAWALLVEVGMMVLPPMAPMVGLFGMKYKWPELFAITLLAHVLFGITVGLLVQHFLQPQDEGWLLPFLLNEGATQQPSSASISD